jgi:hypothetical protein
MYYISFFRRNQALKNSISNIETNTKIMDSISAFRRACANPPQAEIVQNGSF